MRLLYIILLITLISLQHKLWLGDANVRQWFALEKKLSAQKEQNNKLAARNHILEADIKELKTGEQALEEQARYELGMIKDHEEYYHFVD